jgi:WD40 repeat protein
VSDIQGQGVRVAHATHTRARGIAGYILYLYRKASPHSVGAALLAALLLTLAALLISTPARAGLLSILPGAQESSRLAKAYAVLREDFYPTSVAWSPDGRYIADTGILTNTIHVWDVNTRQAIQTLQNTFPATGFQALAWSPDGRYLVGCGRGLKVWDTSTWSLVKDIKTDPPNSPGCTAIAFSPDGRWLAKSPTGPVNVETCIYVTQTWTLKSCTNFRALPTLHGFDFSTDKATFRPGTDQLAIATTGWFSPDISSASRWLLTGRAGGH